MLCLESSGSKKDNRGEMTRKLPKSRCKSKKGRSIFLSCCNNLAVGEVLGIAALMGTQLDTGTPKPQPTAVALQSSHAGDSTRNLDNLGEQLRARLVTQRPREKVSWGW